jgi:L,D-transpeptidase catalytic domain
MLQKLVVFSFLAAFAVGVPAAASAGPRPELLKAALSAEQAHSADVKRTDTIAIIDYTLPSNVPRLFVVNPATGQSEAFLVAHGRGSDPGLTGHATKFSNDDNSHMSSLGAYVTGDTYQGEHGLSLKLIGLDPTNNHAQSRAIVLHGADYVAPGRPVLGRSWGCPAVEPRFVKTLIDRLKGAALIYVAG